VHSTLSELKNDNGTFPQDCVQYMRGRRGRVFSQKNSLNMCRWSAKLAI
jgi:hypothetical protein